jgi:hypothetical protein
VWNKDLSSRPVSVRELLRAVARSVLGAREVADRGPRLASVSAPRQSKRERDDRSADTERADRYKPPLSEHRERPTQPCELLFPMKLRLRERSVSLASRTSER